MPRPQPPLLVPPTGVDHCRTPNVIRVEGVEYAVEEEPARILLRLQSGQQLDIPLTRYAIDTLYEYLVELKKKDRK